MVLDPAQIQERKLGDLTVHIRCWEDDILFGWKMVLWWSWYFLSRWCTVGRAGDRKSRLRGPQLQS